MGVGRGKAEHAEDWRKVQWYAFGRRPFPAGQGVYLKKKRTGSWAFNTNTGHKWQKWACIWIARAIGK